MARSLPAEHDTHREVPGGTVTFLFTDIEGSTKLLERLRGKYAKLLADHGEILRSAFVQWNGHEVDTQGDAFFVTFSRASDAIACAMAAQRALASHDWPDGAAVRVRMALHTGEPVISDDKYIGMDVHVAARIASAGHGGQVLLSQSTQGLVHGDLPPGATLRDLGPHDLKDIRLPQQIFQLDIAGLPTDFPALRTLASAPHFPPLKTVSNTNLPRPASSFVGRKRETAEVISLLRNARLVTLSGPGGCGKTRLAVEAAAELVPHFKAGVFWVGLAPLRDPALVPEAVSRTLGAGKDGLADHIGERELLLLLDNFEPVVDAAPELSALLRTCPNLHLLVTSRELLRIEGEAEYPVPPLAEREAVDLFCARSRLEPDQTITELCQRLDNMPLAVELAAARTSVLSPRQILQRISERLDLLTGGRDAQARHRTLRATIEWSYDLLTTEEQQLFARLAVFAGGCTLEAAEDVCEANVDRLQSLVSKNLLRHSGERFAMLETIRTYALERLEASGDSRATRTRHAERYAALGEAMGPRARNSDQEALEQMEAELDNIRAALEWSLDHDEIAVAQRLVHGAWWIWLTRGFVVEGDRMAQTVFDRTSGISGERANSATLAGEFARCRGDWKRAIALKQQAIEMFEASAADPRRLASTLTDLALTLVAARDYPLARQVAERGLAIRNELGGAYGIAHATQPLVLIALHEREYARAADLADRTASVARAAGSWSDLADSLVLLAAARRGLGNIEGASAHVREALELATTINDRFVLVAVLEEAAAVLLARHNSDAAARIFAAVRQERRLTGLVSTDASEYERLREALEGFSGGRLEEDLRDVVAYAAASLD